MSGFSDLLTEFLKVMSRSAYPHILLTLPVVGLVWLRVLRVYQIVCGMAQRKVVLSQITLQGLSLDPLIRFL